VRAERATTGSDYVEIHDGVRCPGVLSPHDGSTCLNDGNPVARYVAYPKASKRVCPYGIPLQKILPDCFCE
jgi:hypothetical protein